MPKDRYYYDTSIFQLSINSDDPDGDACDRLLRDPEIEWIVVWSELSRHESSLGEYLDNLEVFFSANGIDYLEIDLDSIKSVKRQMRTHVSALRRLRLQPNDVSHVIAACHATAQSIITRDYDFIDPRVKRTNKKRRGRGPNAVAQYVREHFGLRVWFPSEACGQLFSD